METSLSINYTNLITAISSHFSKTKIISISQVLILIQTITQKLQSKTMKINRKVSDILTITHHYLEIENEIRLEIQKKIPAVL